MYIAEYAIGVDRLYADMICPSFHVLVDAFTQGIHITPSEGFVNKAVAEIIDIVFG
jgi:hypothetical protein